MPKTIAEELIEAQGKIAALEADGVKLSGVLAERDKTIVDLQASVKTLTDEKAAMVSAHETAINEVNGKLTAEVTAHEQTGKKLEAATVAISERDKKLANPAYRIASAEGDSKGVEEGGQANSQPEKTSAEAMDEYRKLDGKPEEQKAYRVKHWRVLGITEEK